MRTGWLAAASLLLVAGCATVKESDTARTGVEQLLISSAVDRSLDKIDFRAIAGAKVFVDTQYLDCVDKNYVIVALHERVMTAQGMLVDKREDADVVLEVASGAVGTDRNELFVGVPQIPLPPPSPISIPRMVFYDHTKEMGTAKLRVLAYDAKSRRPVIDSGIALARSSYKHWEVMGAGPVVTGDVPHEISKATGESDSVLDMPRAVAGRVRTMSQR